MKYHVFAVAKRGKRSSKNGKVLWKGLYSVLAYALFILMLFMLSVRNIYLLIILIDSTLFCLYTCQEVIKFLKATE